MTQENLARKMVGIPPSGEIFTAYCRSNPSMYHFLPHPLYPTRPKIAEEMRLPDGKKYQSDSRARCMSDLLAKDPRNAYHLAKKEGLKPDALIVEQFAAGMTIRKLAALFHKHRSFVTGIVEPVFGKLPRGNHCRNISNRQVLTTYSGPGQRNTRKTARILGISADTVSRRLKQIA
ncbi:hypothetical protein [Paracoccus seriniphilus]|uniref:hypothetical protein n=1 Tax=Paracoccus seriniphilus TaxID=184748 RepID=UPI00117BF2F6|nr:hypothetical protein [Paracoccus seriniphilus]WCR14009.1 hypothetical protein JHW44_00525 [Paracoccus seriniphilus]